MNILLATSAFMEADTRAHDLIRLSIELANRGHKVCVLSTNVQGSPYHEVMSNVEIFRHQPLFTLPFPYPVCFPLPQIRKLVTQFDVDLIHAVYSHAAVTLASALFSKTTQFPYILEIQGALETTGRRITDVLARIYDHTLSRFIAKNSRMVVVISESLRQRALFLGCPEDKIAVKPSGVDVDYFDVDHFPTDPTREKLGLGCDEFIVGFVGRLVPLKGLTYLLHAAKKIKKEIPKLHILLVGEGPQKAFILETAKILQVPITITGWVDDPRPYYSVMDVFALPSLSEGLPNVVLEAMAMEKPIIATDVGGNRDLVEDGLNGYLVPPRNVDLLAQRVLTLYERDGSRVSMGSANRKKVQKSFTWDRAVDRTEAIYKKALLKT